MDKRYNTRGVRVDVASLLNLRKRKKTGHTRGRSQGHCHQGQDCNDDEVATSDELPMQSTSSAIQHSPENEVFSTVEAILLPAVQGDVLAKLMAVIDSSCDVKAIAKGNGLGLSGSWANVDAVRKILTKIINEDAKEKYSQYVVGPVAVKEEEEVLLSRDENELIKENLSEEIDVAALEFVECIKTEDTDEASNCITIAPNSFPGVEDCSDIDEDTVRHVPGVTRSPTLVKQPCSAEPDLTGIGLIVTANAQDSQQLILGEQQLIHSHFRKPRGKRAWLCRHCGAKIRTIRQALVHLKQHQSDNDIDTIPRKKSENQASDTKEGGPEKKRKLEGNQDFEVNGMLDEDSPSADPCSQTSNEGQNHMDHALDEKLCEISKLACKPRGTLMFSNPAKATKSCLHCDFRSSKSGIKTHMKRYHSGVIFKCDICPKHFGVRYNLKIHRERHFNSDGSVKPRSWCKKPGYSLMRPEGKFNCDICKHAFLTKNGLGLHTKKTHDKDNFFSNKFVLVENSDNPQSSEKRDGEVDGPGENLKTDSDIQSGEAPSVSDSQQANGVNPEQASLNNVEIVTTVRKEKDCQRAVLKNNYLIANNFRRSGRRLWHCKHCSAQAGTKSRAIKHLKIHDIGVDSIGSDDIAVGVAVDEATVASGMGMNENGAGHHGTKPDDGDLPEISDCSKANSNNRNCLGETITETGATAGDQPHVFQEDLLLQISKLVAKPACSFMYKCPEKATEKCPYCEFRTTETALGNHIKRYHSGITYKCDICLKLLGSYYYLRVHRQGHFDSSGKLKPSNGRNRFLKGVKSRAFCCDICKLKFHRRCHLNAHMKAHKDNAETRVVVRINRNKGSKTGHCNAEEAEVLTIEEDVENLAEVHNEVDETATTVEKMEEEETTEIADNPVVDSVNLEAGNKAPSNKGDIIATLGNEEDCQKMLIGSNYVIESNLTKIASKRLWQCNLCGVQLRPKNKAIGHLKMHGIQLESNKISDGDPADSSTTVDEDHSDSHGDGGQSEAGCHGNRDEAGVTEASSGERSQGISVMHDSSITESPSAGDADHVSQQVADSEASPQDESLCRISKLAKKPGRTFMYKCPDKATEKCPFCDFMSSETGIGSHIKRYHSGIVYNCDVCPKKFGTYSDLRYHRQRHFDADGKLKPVNWRKGYKYRKTTEAPKFICDLCQQGYYRNCDLKQHMKAHELDVVGLPTGDPNKFMCNMCDVETDSYRALQLHANSVHGQKRKCPQCDTICNHPRLLRQHQKYMHPGEKGKKALMCPQCGRVFSQPHYLKAHMVRHQAIKRHFCPTCGKGFVEKHRMKQHSLGHEPGYESPKPFICETCGKRFPKEYCLRDHQNTHTGTRPFECSLCGAQFSYRTSLYKHTEAHTKTASFACDHPDCGKMFKRKRLLTAHRKVHTHSSHFTCPDCDKTYNSATTYSHLCTPTSATATSTATTAPPSITATAPDHSNIIPSPSKTLAVASEDVAKLTSLQATETSEIFMCSECNETSTNLMEIQLHVAQHVSDQNVNTGAMFTFNADERKDAVGSSDPVYIFDEISQDALQVLTIAEGAGVNDARNETETVVMVTQSQ